MDCQKRGWKPSFKQVLSKFDLMEFSVYLQGLTGSGTAGNSVVSIWVVAEDLECW